MLKIYTKILFILMILINIHTIYPWGMHYLVMDRSLNHSSMEFTHNKVKTEPLDELLAAEKKQVRLLFEDYYTWLEKRGSQRFKKIAFDVNHPNTASFLKAARLNPATRFLVINRVMPGNKPKFKEVDKNIVSPYFSSYKGNFTFTFEDVTGQEVSIRSVLNTFADEPDWNMDHRLWGYKEYGYGDQPYGKPEGESSKAPFHMQFLHENFLLKKFAPQIVNGGMMLDRMELFSRLGKLAFQTGHDYWGYRFSAWAAHYVQDLGMPYHAKASPGANFWFYIKYIVSPHKKEMQKREEILLSNRHFAYEDFVSFGLEKSYTEDKPIYKNLVGYLSEGEAVYKDINTPETLIQKQSIFSANHASTTNKVIIESFGKKITQDPSYVLEDDKNFSMNTFLNSIQKEKADLLLAETRKDFAMTGRGTRTMILMILNRANK